MTTVLTGANALVTGATAGIGHAVNVNTVVIIHAGRGGRVYGASQAAVNPLTASWADGFGGNRMRVNPVSSGLVRTCPRIVEETRQYIRDVERLITSAYSAREPFDQVLAQQPNRVNPAGALWVSAQAPKSAP